MKKPIRIGWLILVTAGIYTPTLFSQSAAEPLQIYWIDVEGGSSTLIVAPGGDSILVDAGWNREDARDAQRIQSAMADAGVSEINYFIASHFHGDHVGGTPALAKRIEIHQFFDHGESVEADTERGRVAWDTYLSAAQGNRQTVQPGDSLPLTGADFRFVSANREVINPSDSELNPLCGPDTVDEDLGENSRSVGYQITIGDFEFLDLGDMTADVQHSAACPRNRLGKVDVLQVPHHGTQLAAELIWALAPTVAVSNNGATKGGNANDLAKILQSPGLDGFWQVHYASAAPADLNAEAVMTANLTAENDQGHWIKATIDSDGTSYEITNDRNNYSKRYQTK